MVWVKLDDQFTENPKVVQAGPLAGWLHVSGIVYCGRNLTDGFIPLAMVSRLATFENISVTTGGTPGLYSVGHDIECTELVDRLVAIGLWEVVDGGYVIHDYLDYNPSKADVLAQRNANTKRQADWRERHRDGDGKFQRDSVDTNSVTNGVTNGVSNNRPVPVPVPEREKTHGAIAPAIPVTFEQWRDGYRSADNKPGYAVYMLTTMYPSYYRGDTKPNYGMLAKLLNGSDPEYFLGLIHKHSANPPVGDPVKYLAGVLKKQPQASTNGWQIPG